MNMLLAPVAYLSGAFPTAFVLGKFRNIDITKEGSGNVGGTNTLRVMGWRAGLIVAVVDILKAAIPTYLAAHVFNYGPLEVALVALAAIIGHNWSVFIGFKGGKGIACTIGAGAVLFPQALLISLALGVITVALTRFVSLGSLVLAGALPLVVYLGESTDLNSYPGEYLLFAIILTALAVYRHRENISRLLAGTERKLGRSKS